MKIKILFTASILITSICFGQKITETEIMGKWKTLSVEIPEEVPQKEAVKLIEDAFTGAIFNFKGNKIFTLKLGKKADHKIKEVFKIDGENWKIDDNQIKIGTGGNEFSLMHITIQRIDEDTYFLLPMMRLKMERIHIDKPKPFKKSKNKSSSFQNENAEPVVLKIVELNENEIVPYPIVENPPLAPECNSKWEIEKQKKCINKFLQMHIARKFNADLASGLGIVGVIKIYIDFVFDKNGDVVNITASGGPEIINQNAIEVIARLPKFKPGSHNGQPVNVSYRLPLTFRVE